MPTIYTRYAVACLAITVLAGTWMRLALVIPAWLGPFDFQHAIHAHSHVALFGWTTMALMALVVRAAGIVERDPAPGWARWHPHALGLASLVAFVGFLLVGYVPPTIALATLHVLLWWTFVALAWRPLGAAPPVERRYWRGALAMLAVAGVGAMAPGPVRVLGVADRWVLDLSVELFLTPFVQGWLGLGVAGVIYGRMERPRFEMAVFWFLVVGSLPAALFRSAAAPPAAWLPAIGRVATVLVGVAALLLAADMLREARNRPPTPLLRLATVALLLKGLAEVGVGVGLGGELLGSRQLVVAYLHLLLLGVVTPVLLMATVARSRVPRLALAQGVGLAATLAALATLGVPWLVGVAVAAGLTARGLLGVALAGGAVSTVGVLGVVGEGWWAGSTDEHYSRIGLVKVHEALPPSGFHSEQP